MFWKLSDMDKSKFVNRKTKKVDKVDLNPSCFAFVGDIEDTSTWKLPIRILGDERRTVNHIKSALARFDETKGIPDEHRRDVWFTIRGAALAHGLQVPVKTFATASAQKADVKVEVKAQQINEDKSAHAAIAAAIAEADALSEKMLRKLGLE